MKFYLVFAAVLLSTASAKVMPMPEDTKVPDVAVTVPIEATVIEVPKDHVQPMSVSEVNKVPTTVPVGVVKVPLSPNSQVPQTMDDVKKSEKPMDTKEPVVEMHQVPEITQLSPMPVTESTPDVTTVAVEDASTNNYDPNSCDILCTRFELNPICAVNAECVHEFPNQCTMDTFNCLHPDRAFNAVKDERCKMHWLKHCTEKDLQI